MAQDTLTNIIIRHETMIYNNNNEFDDDDVDIEI